MLLARVFVGLLLVFVLMFDAWVIMIVNLES